MRGISELIGFALVILIMISSIMIATNIGLPAMERMKSQMSFREAKIVLSNIDSNIRYVASEPKGSRSIDISASGEYFLDGENDKIMFRGPQMNQTERGEYTQSNLIINSTGDYVYVWIEYENIDIIGQGAFGNGKLYTLSISGNGTSVSIAIS